MRPLLSLLVGSFVAVSPAATQTATWKVDPAHSNVLIGVTHMVISEVTGQFKEFDATLVQTKEDFSDSQIEAIIKASSIDTENNQRDQHLRSADFLDATNHPDITFKSKSVKKAGNNMYRIEGELTIRGVTKPVMLQAKYNGQVKDPYGNTRAGFKATTTINRFDFGVKWNAFLETGALIVSEDVDIVLNVEFVKQKPTQ